MEDPVAGGAILPFIPKSDPEKLNIIRRVAKKLSKDERPGLRPRVFELTGLTPNVTNTLATLSSESEIHVKIMQVDRSAVYNRLVHFYLEEKVMPSTYELFLSLEDQIPKYMDIGEFRKYLLKNGFMWKQISKGYFVVTEKPEVIFERFCYLKHIQSYRNEKRPIYFIEESVFDSKGTFLTFEKSVEESKRRANEPLVRMLYAVSENGLQFQEYVKKFNEHFFMMWIKKALVKSLPEPSVIVLNNYQQHCEEIVKAPNIYSKKKEICDWLDYFNVPYDDKMAKHLLYELVENYTDVNQKCYAVDNLLKSLGHTVLRIPDCIKKLTPAAFFIEKLRNNLPNLVTQRRSEKDKTPGVQVMIDIIVHTLSQDTEEYDRFFESIANEEKLIQQMDEAVDAEMDDLERMMQMCPPNYTAYDSDLPSDDSDSD
uniref:Uncharacterized protein n=1 Tax=Heliothis virescens TaxID=7102 RepID=A0A2A4J9G4_HELVI